MAKVRWGRALTPLLRPKPDIDQTRLLPHLRAVQPVFVCDNPEAFEFVASSKSVSTYDPQNLRGIPVIGRGVGGTSPGTNPAAAVERKLDR